MSLQSFQALVSVHITHGYFAPAPARHLVFDPCQQTQALIARFGLLLRSDENSLALHAPADRLQALWSHCSQAPDEAVRFQLRSTDPLCALYTASNATAVPPSYLPDPESFSADPTQPGRLIPGAAMLASAQPAQTAGLVLGELALPLTRPLTRALTHTDGPAPFEQWTALLGMPYTLHIEARETTWKYLLLGDWHEEALAVTDAAQAIDFSPPEVEKLPNGRKALVIRSQQPIALQARPPQRFQLQSGHNTPPKVLVPRMPNAAPSGLAREQQSGVTALVAEIFVSR